MAESKRSKDKLALLETGWRFAKGAAGRSLDLFAEMIDLHAFSLDRSSSDGTDGGGD